MNRHQPLEGRTALVAGATRGAGRPFAIELAAAGATVYATGRSSEKARSEIDRPETIEGTAALATDGGGEVVAVVCQTGLLSLEMERRDDPKPRRVSSGRMAAGRFTPVRAGADSSCVDQTNS